MGHQNRSMRAPPGRCRLHYRPVAFWMFIPFLKCPVASSDSQSDPSTPSESPSRLMKFSQLTERIAGEGADAWAVHYKAMRRRRAGEEIIVLSVGEPNFDTPPAIIAAAKQALDAGRTHYTDITGDPPLRAAIARYHGKRSGQAVTPENVVVMAGAQCALFSAALCILDPGDEIIVPSPMYVTYEAAIGVSGATMSRVPLRAENRFRLKAEDVASAVNPRTKAVMVNSPHNPTGAVIQRQEWEA